MPPERAEIVRQPIAVGARERRRPEQQLIRFPRVFALCLRVMWRLYVSLPPRSGLRRAMARRYAQQGVEALNRRDMEATFAAYHPDVESIWDQRLVELGFERVYRGREARIAAQLLWHAEWGDWRLELDELIDLGDSRALLLGRVEGTGISSGAAVDSECGFLATISSGQVVREEVFFNRAEAVAAAGLSR